MPQILSDLERYALQYVRDGGEEGRTRVGFMEDFEEAGPQAWNAITVLGFVGEGRDGKVRLTDSGVAALDGL